MSDRTVGLEAGQGPGIRRNLDRLERGSGLSWWAIVIRGLVALAFGVLMLSSPGIGVAALIFTFAAYAAVDGIFALATAVTHGRAGLSWGWWLFEGIVSLAIAALAVARPGLTLLAIVLLIAFRAIVLGILELGGAVTGRELDHRWMLGLTGVVSLVFGILLIAEPFVGAVAIVWAVGVYAVVFGLMMVFVGLRAFGRSRGEHHPPLETRSYAT